MAPYMKRQIVKTISIMKETTKTKNNINFKRHRMRNDKMWKTTPHKNKTRQIKATSVVNDGT